MRYLMFVCLQRKKERIREIERKSKEKVGEGDGENKRENSLILAI